MVISLYSAYSSNCFALVPSLSLIFRCSYDFDCPWLSSRVSPWPVSVRFPTLFIPHRCPATYGVFTPQPWARIQAQLSKKPSSSDECERKHVMLVHSSPSMPGSTWGEVLGTVAVYLGTAMVRGHASRCPRPRRPHKGWHGWIIWLTLRLKHKMTPHIRGWGG